MLFRLFSRPKARRTGATLRRPVHSFRPTVETLEAREVLASPASLGPPALGAALVSAAAPQHQALAQLPLRITNVAVQNGQLVANGLLAGIPFTAPLALTAEPAAAGATTRILDLHIGKIHVDLLGLNIDTSEICLKITAQSGPGKLLGNLLTDIAHLLDNPNNTLGSILGNLSATDLRRLTNGLTDVLNGALRGARAAVTPGTPGNILHLELGPVNLNLLGLKVDLDNCHGGPITVDISAVPGPGNLLGNLLSGLTHLLDTHSPTKLLHRVEHLVDKVEHFIQHLEHEL